MKIHIELMVLSLLLLTSCATVEQQKKEPILEKFWHDLDRAGNNSVVECKNLFPDFKNSGGILVGFVKKRGEYTKITIIDKCKKDGHIQIAFDAPKKDTVYLDSMKSIQLQEKGKYLFCMDIKAENVVQRENRRCLILYIYGRNNRHVWAALKGSGSTDGWITAEIPFDTSKDNDFSSIKLFIRCYDMSGILKFKNPVLFKLPVKMKLNAQFRRQDGTIAPHCLSLEQEGSNL